MEKKNSIMDTSDHQHIFLLPFLWIPMETFWPGGDRRPSSGLLGAFFGRTDATPLVLSAGKGIIPFA